MVQEFFKDKPHIKLIETVPHSPEWFEFRHNNGYGGSEIASVVSGKSKTLAELVYTPSLKLHLLKAGEPIQEFTGNVESESGQFFEPIIKNFYRHYDMDKPDALQMYRNIKAHKEPINTVLEPQIYATNEKWPWLFYSPDGFGRINGVGPLRLLECKHTTSMEARRYKLKVSPSFYAQVQQGLMITELDHADLLIFIDGKWFEPITVTPNQEWFTLIQETSYKAWMDVLEARKLKLEYDLPAYFGMNPDYFTEKQKEGAITLSKLEPDLSGTESELEFIKELIVPVVEEKVREGTEDVLRLCLEFLSIDDSIKSVAQQKDVIYEKLLLALGKECNVMMYDNQQLFTYKMDKRGTCRLLMNKELKTMYSDAY